MKKGLSGGLTVGLLILGLVLSLGVRYIFHACDITDDGTYMSCHWAQNAVMTAGGVLAVVFAMALFARDKKVRTGMLFAALPITVSAMLLASNLIIRLCAMKEMHCWAVMRRGVFIVGAVILIVCITDLIVTAREPKNNGISR